MEDRIRQALANIRNQKYPLTDALDNTYLSSDQFSELMKEFWIPTEVLQQTCDRIRSSSMDDPEPPPPPEHNALEDLNQECGLKLPNIITAITVLNDGLEHKLQEIKELENTLKGQEKMIQDYNGMIHNFRKNLGELPFSISISGQDMFLETLNHTIYQKLLEQRIPEKIKRFQYLTSQIRMIRKITNISRNTNVNAMPQCTICYTQDVTSALVPCGHMFCEQCLSNLSNDNKCFICRRRSSRILRLFPN
jgi:hypothetical protein